MTTGRFRYLVLSLWGLLLLYALASTIGQRTLPDALRSYVAARPVSTLDVLVAAIVVLVSLWNSYELYHFRGRSRVVFLVFIACSYLLAPLLPPMVEPSLAYAFLSLQSVVVGALIVAMLWSPVAPRFTDSHVDAA
jgi:hypothetical protein